MIAELVNSLYHMVRMSASRYFMLTDVALGWVAAEMLVTSATMAHLLSNWSRASTVSCVEPRGMSGVSWFARQNYSKALWFMCCPVL